MKSTLWSAITTLIVVLFIVMSVDGSLQWRAVPWCCGWRCRLPSRCSCVFPSLDIKFHRNKVVLPRPLVLFCGEVWIALNEGTLVKVQNNNNNNKNKLLWRLNPRWSELRGVINIFVIRLIVPKTVCVCRLGQPDHREFKSEKPDQKDTLSISSGKKIVFSQSDFLKEVNSKV